MKFYLIDDDQNILNILKLIIKNRNLGEICGTSLNPADALEDLKIHPAGHRHCRPSYADHGRHQLCKKSGAPLPKHCLYHALPGSCKRHDLIRLRKRN